MFYLLQFLWCILIVFLVLIWTRFCFDQSPRSIELSPRLLPKLSTSDQREKLLKVVSWAQMTTEVGWGKERERGRIPVVLHELDS